jgi:hypothetical protein
VSSLATTIVSFSSPFDWVMFGFGVLIAIWGTPMIRRVWSGKHSFLTMHDPPRPWPWSAPLWRGYVRTLAALPVAWWLSLATLLVDRLTPRSSPLVWLAVAVSLVWAIVMFVVVPAIVLFAWPTRLIPPAVRREPGAIAEWRRARARRG